MLDICAVVGPRGLCSVTGGRYDVVFAVDCKKSTGFACYVVLANAVWCRVWCLGDLAGRGYDLACFGVGYGDEYFTVASY